MRLLVLALAILLAGCSASPSVRLDPVNGDLTSRDRGTLDRSPSHPDDGVGSDPPAGPPACTTENVRAGDSLFARIRCESGSGQAASSLDGCDASEQSWLTLETEDGRLATGNATATASTGSGIVASLRVSASDDDGKERILDGGASYSLTVDLDAWKGEWVTASIECAAA
ncbi:MAG: hypothetical protein LC620_08300 [Halobacteriales archaeon]|nr:hypothetical protein [Halobacteriales archaeon]